MLTQRLREEQQRLQDERDLRSTQQAEHEAITSSLQASAEHARKQADAALRDMRAELDRVRQQGRHEVEDTHRIWQEKVKVLEAENATAVVQARAEGELFAREESSKLLRAQQAEWDQQQQALRAQITALEIEASARQQNIDSLQARYVRLRDLFGHYEDMGDSEAKLAPAEEAALKLVELRTRLDKEVEENKTIKSVSGWGGRCW